LSDFHDERGMELRDLFFETAPELLQALNEESLKLEKNPGDEEIVRSIRRTVHTLKGDSAAVGLRELSELAHLFEDALSLESAAAHGALAEICFAAADLFSAMFVAYQGGGPLPATESLRKRIAELTSAKTTPKAGRSRKSSTAALKPGKDWSEAEKQAVARAQAAGAVLYDVTVKIDPHCSMPIAARQLIHNAAITAGEVLVMRPEAKNPAASKHVEFVLASSRAVQEIAAKCNIPTISGEISVRALADAPVPKARKKKAPKAAPPVPSAQGESAAPEASPKPSPEPITLLTEINSEIAARPLILEADEAPTVEHQGTTEPASTKNSPPASPTAAKAPPAGASEGTAAAGAENILRVEAGRIDNVLNLVGELIIGKSMLQQALNELGKRYPKEALRGKFSDAMAFQSRVLNDLQRSVMKIRMVPVEHLFRRFPRIVRDVARQCGREVDLELSGQETDLDKGILDAIAEPLTHLVRNAVSHGIESAEERRRMGKPPRGKIRLNSFHQGNQVMVEISDDGRGIDVQKIRAKALDLKLISAEEAARLSEGETLELIFRPGFSTAEVVTEVSGRGVGMDVVQSVLQRLKATIHIDTRPGQGTTFRLKLPLTLAIIKALMFWVENRLYAIPLNAVSQIARSTESEVHQVDNYEVLQLRNQVLPLLRLGRKPGSGNDPISGNNISKDPKSIKLFVLVINVGEKRYGLIVDKLEGEEELVIKALDDQTFVTDLVNGASILGDGKVVLILNLAAVVEHVSKARPTAVGETNSGLLLNQDDRIRLAAGMGGTA
jgi:two-component system chemotaxis sensor kinase CheA